MVSTSHAQPAAAPLKVAFVYVTPVGQAGWTYQHDLGRREMERALGDAVKTTVVEDVAEGPDAERVMRDLASQGHKLIFATSFGYLEGALRVAAEFPAVRFEHAGGYKTAPNLNTYNVRAYEARWLAGRLAALNSKSGVAGYVAGFPVPEVVQGINAFALGMRSVNPTSQRARGVAEHLVRPRARARRRTRPGQPGRRRAGQPHRVAGGRAGRRREGRQADRQPERHARASRRDAQLAAVMPSWGGYYTQVARDVIAARWKPEPVWGGLRSGMVALGAFDGTLPAQQLTALDGARQSLVEGRASVFAAPLIDNAGRTRLASGTLNDARIAGMDWLVQGVVGSMPTP